MSRPSRLQGFEYRGHHSYFLTFCTYNRRETFIDTDVAARVLAQILHAAARFEFAVLAYCMMPDHIHLLLHGKSDRADLRRFVKRAKQSTAQRFRSVARPFWQEGYYDRVIRPEEALSGIARYIIENPLRAGIVKSARDYPFVGSDTWSVEEILR